MKRNPLYSPNAKSEQNGHVKFTFPHFNGGVDSHGDVIMPGSFNHFGCDFGVDNGSVYEFYIPETKQERFNRIFDVQDAEIV